MNFMVFKVGQPQMCDMEQLYLLYSAETDTDQTFLFLKSNCCDSKDIIFKSDNSIIRVFFFFYVKKFFAASPELRQMVGFHHVSWVTTASFSGEKWLEVKMIFLKMEYNVINTRSL